MVRKWGGIATFSVSKTCAEIKYDILSPLYYKTISSIPLDIKFKAQGAISRLWWFL
jgi:hypothetical protein